MVSMGWVKALAGVTIAGPGSGLLTGAGRRRRGPWLCRAVEITGLRGLAVVRWQCPRSERWWGGGHFRAC